ncbi:hypothetical protein FB45DRAFT_1020976 [Roridomyces roridus]|uniref:Carbohydrate esterase family 16 protein n=1 Tax=Roridomyces roridus TaxID=1738132 RepID=A0AAD7FX69_9AGAR|nr:hypothetical protein FB45DRAFT_1020976 [Roridomyces roridus]
MLRLLVLAAGAVVATAARNAFDWDSITHMYAFGDSYTFVGGTLGHANFSFIGDAFDLAFTPAQLLQNQIIFRNTSSDGANWIEFLTGCFEGEPSECTKQLWDFAFAGSDIDGNLLPLHHNFTVPLDDQVEQWVTYASEVIPHPEDSTMTAWWIGINDTGDSLGNSSVSIQFSFRYPKATLEKISNFTEFFETEMTSYFTSVQKAHDNGLHTHLFINVPAEERSPSSLGSPTKAASLKANILLYNSILAQHITAFKATNPDATIMTFDSNSWFNQILDTASEFGFTNITGFCTCTDPEGFFWFDSGHPTEAVHKLLANAIETELRDPTFV